MELKHSVGNALYKLNTLLIVPYGIETNRCAIFCNLVNYLLIVPYGIETPLM